MTTTPTPRLGRNDVGDHVLIIGTTEVLGIVDDGELGDPSIVVWNAEGSDDVVLPLADYGHDYPHVEPHRPSADQVAAMLAAFHPDLPAAVGHAMAAAVDEANVDAPDRCTLADQQLVAAARAFRPIADELAAASSNYAPEYLELDLDLIAHELRVRHGFPGAYVEMTGGGCATVFVGATFADEYGDPEQLAMAGPGWFSQPGYQGGRARSDDFSIGTLHPAYHTDQPEDTWYVEGEREAEAADRVARLARLVLVAEASRAWGLADTSMVGVDS